MTNSLTIDSSAPQPGATVNVTVGGAPPTGDLAGAIAARFAADAALKNWQGKRADLQKEHEAIQAEREALAAALKTLREEPPPEREYPAMTPPGVTPPPGVNPTSWWEEHFGRTSQAYVDWQKRRDDAAKLVK